MNPIALIDTLLNDYIPARYRRLLHGVILFVGLVYGIYEAADKDWKQAGITLAVALYAAANKANTGDSDDNADLGEDDYPDDDTIEEDVEEDPTLDYQHEVSGNSADASADYRA